MPASSKRLFTGNRCDAAVALFSHLEQWGGAYCIVGMTDNLPSDIPGDLDIVVASGRERAFARQLHRFCRDCGLGLVQALQHETTATYYVLCWRGESGELQFLHPDVCGDYLRSGRQFLAASEILAGRRLASDGAGNTRGFHIPAPASEFLYYLLKRIDKDKLGDREGAHLSAQWQGDPKGAERQVQRFWRGASGREILDAARKNAWGKICERGFQ